ncbi:DUF397 domain-containing protein [Streptomyces sp. NPDC059009]|uniref:DUF397 domain-containing protein n=1 Tax=Streptomyces sp. NPDC059009 TaxID=3346694 RepID=UPI0036CD1B48
MSAHAHPWQKSSYCGQGDSCVHVAADGAGTVHITESADPAHSILTTTPEALAALLRAAKAPKG